MKWYLKCLKQYADFTGRARRKEYWMFYLFNLIFVLLTGFIGGFIGALVSGGDEDLSIGIAYGLYFLYVLVVLTPSLAVTVRRLHDIGKSGWWLFIVFIPIVGPIWLLVLLITDSEDENEYGKYPK